MKNAPVNLRKLESVSIVIALFLMAGFAMVPMAVNAPPARGTLNVTWENLAPYTNTFQGDVNLSMLWLALEAQNADITLESIQVDVYGLPPEGINRTFAWDDRDYDKNMSFAECVIAEDAGAPYLLPPVGQMIECTGPNIGQPVLIQQDTSRYFTIYLDLDFDPAQRFTDRDLRVCVNDGSITSSAKDVVGLPACSRTIEINTRFFYDDMEHGQGDWTFAGGDDGGVFPDGLWHLSQGEEDCINNVPRRLFFHSRNTSWWYGHRFQWFGDWVCTYYTNQTGTPLQSTRNWGELRTPWIDARRGTSLAMTVWHFLAREPNEGLDTAKVYLNDGSEWHFITSEWNTDDNWRKLILNLSAYAGKQVQLEFRFDTVEEMNNMYFGWFVDDLTIYGEILEHDIAVSDLDLPSFVSLDPQNVTARVSNIGANDENNIEVNLTQDGSLVDQKTLSFLASGDNTTVDFSWTPPGEGVYEICVQSTPVPGETFLWNNDQCKSVNATSQTFTKVAILRSYGTQADGPKATWDYLNNNWGDYGSSPMTIDYTSLDIHPITYEAISSTQADVLVLSGSGYYFRPPMGTELDDSEVQAIEKWVIEGHGFVTIGTAFSELVPNNNDLVDLVGIVDQPYARAAATLIEVDSGCTGHPVFSNIPGLFESGFNRTMTPLSDQSWDPDDLDGGQMCALSPGNGSVAIVVFKGSVMISFSADVTPTQEEYQLLYNSFVWSRFQSHDYDVRVSDLYAPRFVRPTFPAKVSSIVSNFGKKDLSTVRVDLKVDGTPVDTQNINNLIHGEWTWVNFTWVPSSVGTYEICVFVDIVGFTDEDPSNNEVCTSIEITNNPPVQIYVLDSWGTDHAHETPWDYLNANWANHGNISIYIDYVRFNKENIRYQELVDSYADVLVVSHPRSADCTRPAEADPVSLGYYFTDDEMNAIMRYTQEGHGIIATAMTFDSNKLPGHSFFLGPLFGMDPGNVYTCTVGINDLYVVNPSENHPLFQNIPDNYNTMDGKTTAPGFYMSGPENWTPAHLAGGVYKALSNPPVYAAVIAHETGVHNAVYITSFIELNSNMNDRQLLYNAMIWGRSGVKPPTDLWVYKSGNTLRLEWVESASSGVQGYRIYRATSVNGFDFGQIYDVVSSGVSQWTDPEPNVGIDSNNYFYIVRAFDERGNEDQNLNKVGKFVRQLYKGTNEISIGFELRNHATSVAFESVDGLYKKIEAYDPYTCTWREWTQTGGSLTDISRSMGLRVRMQSDGLLINVGRVTSTSIVLPATGACNFWNFVGYPSFETKSLPGVLDNGGMAGKYDLVLFFDPTDKKAKWKFFDPNDPGGSTLKELSPGMGIWIHVIQAGTWEVKGD